MLISEIYKSKDTRSLFTVVMPSGTEGNELMVLCDWVVRGDEAFPVFRDIAYCQPIYMHFDDLRMLLGPLYQCYNFWSIDEIEGNVEHMD